MEIIGQSDRFLEFQEKLSQVAPVDRPVLLIGERGTGKELAADRIHYLSHRWDGPLVALNCSALSPTLIEAELFGHEKGAFTGAEKRRAGRFEKADGGTLFLDEIGLIPLEVQEKILRVVEYGSFERVGGGDSVTVDVRIVGATNSNLKEMVSEGTFKADLLDRLSFEVLFVPPLRFRDEDVLLLASHFATRFSFELKQDTLARFSEKAKKALLDYRWPGNVRELKNVVERAVYTCSDGMIRDFVFDPFVSPYSTSLDDCDNLSMETDVVKERKEGVIETLIPDLGLGTFKEQVKSFEEKLLRVALQAGKYNQKKAAKMLGLSYDQLRRLLKKYPEVLR